MHPFTAKSDRLDTLLETVISQLEGISSHRLNQHPEPGSWSAFQVLSHLQLSESYSISYCKKKLSAPKVVSKSKISAYFRSKVLNWYLLAGLKAEAPSRVSSEYLPKSGNFEDVRDTWIGERQELKAWLTSIPAQYHSKAIYKHPYAGYLTINGMLSFFEAHFIHHVPQISHACGVKLILPSL